MYFPCPFVMPEADRISVSIRSCTTGARAGITDRSSASLAGCHSVRRPSCAHPHTTSVVIRNPATTPH